MRRSRRAVDALISGCIVYASMAACSSSKNMMATTTTTTGSGGHGTSGQGGSGGKGHPAFGGHTGTGGMLASGGHPGMGGHPGTGGAVGSGGMMGMGGVGTGATDSGIIDALMDPVVDAFAGVENPQSGTRLKGKYTMGSDGSKEYQYTTYYQDPHGSNGPFAVRPVWYDSMLQDDCTFAPATDNKLHCLPGVPTPGPNGPAGFGLMYTDAQCTQPIVAQFQAGVGCLPYTPPKYVQQQIAVNCTATTANVGITHVFQLGSPAAQPAQLYGYGSPCQVLNSSNYGNVMAWYSVTEVAPSTFVQGTVGIDP